GRRRPSGSATTGRGVRSRTTSRSTRSPRSRATIAAAGRASRSHRRPARAAAAARRSRASPTILGDRDQLAQRGLELVVRRAVDPVPQDLEDRGFGTPVDENDEAKAMPALVLDVELGELGEHGRILVRSLLGGRTGGGSSALPDRRMGVENLLLLLEGELVHERA